MYILSYKGKRVGAIWQLSGPAPRLSFSCDAIDA
jgi:hypothetical protein